ncbi:MAG TPA: YeeE/YedE thiosulfate transporter family protein [Solirubrobacteraceae bacterium]|nr:YeeE/YedE thiosulfate transporter family protein [Solirubrobacteraceae bacterium]
MVEVLTERAPWYVVGACLGLVVVGVMAVLGERVGAVGGYSELVDRATRRATRLGWRAWFLVGIVGGAALFVIAGGTTPAQDGYGWVTRTLDGEAAFLAAPLLFGAGALIGYGAKSAGGCTSGNGLCGSALGSPSSLVATATFMATAIGVAFLLEAVV